MLFSLVLLLFIITVSRVANIWSSSGSGRGKGLLDAEVAMGLGLGPRPHTQRRTVAGSSERLCVVATESQYPGEGVKT